MIWHNRSVNEVHYIFAFMCAINDSGHLVCFVSRYIAELLAEKQKIAPFMQVLPCTSRLLNQGKSLVTRPLNLVSYYQQRGIVIFLRNNYWMCSYQQRYSFKNIGLCVIATLWTYKYMHWILKSVCQLKEQLLGRLVFYGKFFYELKVHLLRNTHYRWMNCRIYKVLKKCYMHTC